MINSVVISAPAALALVAALAVAALVYRRWLDAPLWMPPVPTPVGARHRLAGAATPYRPRPWSEIAAELTAEIPEIHARWSSDELDVALDEAERAADRAWVEDTRELEEVNA